MEKHINKKLFAGILALSAGFVLASCDPITSVPANYNEQIIANVDLDDNKLGTIYDQVDSDRNSKIVSNKLKEIAIKRFGSYQDIEKAKADPEFKKTYLNEHSDFFGTVEADQNHRFDQFYKDIRERISEYFYNEISSGSYNDDEGRFDEEKLYYAHFYEFYDVEKPAAEVGFAKFYVTKDVTKENAFSLLNGKYSSAEGRGYIEEKVFPDILKDKLVEDYVYRNNQSSIGRSYARYVSYIKVSYEDHTFAWDLLKSFASTYINGTAKDELDEGYNKIKFEVVTNAIKGFRTLDKNGGVDKMDSGDSFELLQSVLHEQTIEDNNFVKANSVHTDNIDLNGDILIHEGTYYKATKLGALIESYQKACKAEEDGRFATAVDAAELAKFTGDGKSKQYGLRQKLIELAKEDYTTEGWFVKNGGLSELPSEAIRNRLFNIRVANTLDATSGKNALFNETEGHFGEYEYEHDEQGQKKEELVKTLPYMRSINGKKVILPAGALSYTDEPFNYIHQDKDGKAFYIVQVLEAPSKAKLSDDSSTRYTEDYKVEDISRKVAKLLGTKESYTKDAYTEYLNKYSDFKFYDSSFYEYLKAEFPDLNCFEDEE